MKLKEFTLDAWDYKNPDDPYESSFKDLNNGTWTRDGRRVDCVYYAGSSTDGYTHNLPGDIIGIIYEDDGDPWLGFWNTDGSYVYNLSFEEEISFPSEYDLMLEDEEDDS